MEKVNSENINLSLNPSPSLGEGKGTDLSIIIVSYKSKDHLAVLVPSIFGSEGMDFEGAGPSLLARRDVSSLSLRQRGRNSELSSDHLISNSSPQGEEGLPVTDKLARYKAEIIVVDNGSNDGTAKWVEDKIKNQSFDLSRPSATLPTPGEGKLMLLRNTNSGFAAGNNLGIRQAQGKYILLLNPDTKLRPDTLEVMLDFMESHSQVGISGCKIIKPDGKLDLACRRRFPNPWNSFKRLFLFNNEDYNYSNIDPNTELEVDSVVGAFLLIRKSVVEKIGLLDESFFMYGEDLDWCWRCKEAGFKVWYYPKTAITHYKGSSSSKAPFQALRWFHSAMWIFYRKHYSKKHPFVFSWLVWCGIYFRFGLLVAGNVFKSNPRVSR